MEEFKTEVTESELQQIVNSTIEHRDKKERAEGRFQFNTVLVLATVAIGAFVFQGSPVVIGLCIGSFLAWILFFRDGN